MLTLDTAPDVLKVAEVAKIIRCDVKGVYTLIKTGELPAIRIGRTLRVTRTALERFLGDEGTDQTGQPQSVKDRRLKGQRSEP